MKKTWVRIAIAVAVLLLAVVIVVPFLVNADSFRPTVENQLTSALGRNVTLGHLSFSVFTGNLVAENIAIADDPAFSASPMLTAKSLSIGVELGKLLFHKQISITRLSIDTPAIQLIQAKGGVWNFSSLGGSTAKTNGSAPTSAPPPAAAQPGGTAQGGGGTVSQLVVGELKIENGSATISSLSGKRKPAAYADIKADVKQFSFAGAFPFELSASLPGGGKFDLRGTAGPVDLNNTAATPFQATLKISHFDPVAADAVDAASGISMLLDIDAQLASDGKEMTSSGKIQAEHLHLAKGGAPAKKPVDVNYSIAANLAAETGEVRDIAVTTGSVAAHVNGTYAMKEDATVLDLHLSAPNLPIDQLEELLPAVGVTLPSGSSLRGGTLTANLTITGPATGPTIAGPVDVENTVLAGFDIGSRIQGMNPFKGSGGGTTIQTLKADVDSTPAATQFANIYADLPQVGTASGSGSVSAAEDLDFNLVAKFDAATGVGAMLSKGVNAVTDMLGKTLNNNAANGIPLTVSGKASDPSIKANFGQLLRPNLGNPAATTGSGLKSTATGLMKGMLGKH